MYLSVFFRKGDKMTENATGEGLKRAGTEA